MRKSVSFLCCLVLVCSLFNIAFAKKVYATNNKRTKLNILEIQPGNKYELDKAYFDLFSDYDINIVQMPMSEFIGKIEKINGLYDIVYIGNNNGFIINNVNHSIQYTKIGEKPKYTGEGIENGINSSEYYSENDITNKKAKDLKEFIESGQLTVFSQDIFEDSNSKHTKLSSIFNQYRSGEINKKKNFVEIGSSLFENIQLKYIIKDSYYSLNKRPILNITFAPKEYTGNLYDPSTDRNMSFTFNMNSANQLSAKLYLDINGDGLFKENEKKAEIQNKPNGTYTLQYEVPDNFCGLMPWKLEITDEKTGVKSYEVGGAFFKVADGQPTPKTRILQIAPNKNSFSINSLANLRIDGVYDFKTTKKTISEFNDICQKSSDKDTILNGNYDMVILGFSDMYYNNEFNDAAIETLKKFIGTGQSAMFTHDTFNENINSSKFTKAFRDCFGQSRYVDPNNLSRKNLDGSDIPHAIYPDNSGNLSYGFTTDSLRKNNLMIPLSMLDINYSNNIYKVNDGMFTQFPIKLERYDLFKNLNSLQVSSTHYQYFQLNLEDEDVIPWFTIKNEPFPIKHDARNYYYTYTKENLTFSGSGHTSPYGITHEIDLFINTMYKAARTANHAPTLQVNNLINGQNVPRDQESLTFSFIPNDIDGDKLIGNVSMYTDTENIINIDYNKTELSLGEAKEVTLDLTKVLNGVYSFKIKVQVKDEKGAEAEEVITIYIKPTEPEIKRVITNGGVNVKLDESGGNNKIFYDGAWHDYIGPAKISEGQKVHAKQVKEVDKKYIESEEVTRYIPVRELH